MRLINSTSLEIKEFPGDRIPPYAILSHVWSDSELTYAELFSGSNKESHGYQKLTKLCEIARSGLDLRHLTNLVVVRDGRQFFASNNQLVPNSLLVNLHSGCITLDWVWIDTCCIDKGNSSELSEAINSMYKWYRDSTACIVFLPDVSKEPEHWQFEMEFSQSAWFKRGWTLQELIAPCSVVFYNSLFRYIGNAHKIAIPKGRFVSPRVGSLHDLIHTASSIDTYYLHDALGSFVFEACVAKRMSWAAHRETTRGENRSYSLLGLFNVNMPLIYGEGPTKAFLRLQEQILSRSTDQSIWMWTSDRHDARFGLHARGPDEFAYCRNAVASTSSSTFNSRAIHVIGQRGAELELSVPRGLQANFEGGFWLLYPLRHGFRDNLQCYLILCVDSDTSLFADHAHRAQRMGMCHLSSDLHVARMMTILRGTRPSSFVFERVLAKLDRSEPSLVLRVKEQMLTVFCKLLSPRNIKLYFNIEIDMWEAKSFVETDQEVGPRGDEAIFLERRTVPLHELDAGPIQRM